MATNMISALGAGSGVDVQALAQSLVDAEKVPREAAINTKIDDQERRVAGYSALMLALETVKTAFEKLNDVTDFNAYETTNSQPDALGVAVTSGAAPGRHTVEVQQLAASQKTATNQFASADQVLSGGNPFSIQLTLNGESQTSIRVSDPSPQGLVDAINDAEQGVTAQLLNTGDATNPYTVVLTGPVGSVGAFGYTTDDATGTGQLETLTFQGATEDGTISVGGVAVEVTAGQTATEVAEAVRAALETSNFITQAAGRSVVTGASAGTLSFQWAAADGAAPELSFADADTTGAAMTRQTDAAFVAGAALSDVSFSGTNLQDAQDAQLLVNGLSITRGSNAVDGVIPGVYLDLFAMTTGTAANIRITRDTSAVKENVQAVVQAYNDATSDFAILTGARSEDEEDIYSGSLAGDSTVRRVKEQLRSMFLNDSSTPGSSLSAFRDLGLDIDRTGVMSVNEDKLDAALADNFDDVVQLFSANTNKQSNFGTANRGLAGDAVKAIDDLIAARGVLATQSAGSEQRITSYQAELEALNTRMESLLARYNKQFGVMESLVGQSNAMRESLKSTFEGMMAMYTNN